MSVASNPQIPDVERNEIIQTILAIPGRPINKQIAIAVFEFPDLAGRLVVERTDWGLSIWATGFDWPIAMIDLFHCRANADPDDAQQGTVLVQLDDYRTGGNPIRQCYLDGDHIDILDVHGTLVETCSVPGEQP